MDDNQGARALNILVKHMRASNNMRFKKIKPQIERLAIAVGKRSQNPQNPVNKRYLAEAGRAYANTKRMTLNNAVKKGYIGIARTMLEGGTSSNDNLLRQAIARPSANRVQRKNLIRLVVNHLPDDSLIRHPMYQSIAADDIDTFEIIYSKYGIQDTPNLPKVMGDGYVNTKSNLKPPMSTLEPLYHLSQIAVESCSPRVLQFLISQVPPKFRGIFLNYQWANYQMKTLLMNANNCETRARLDVLRVLLDAGARIDIIRNSYSVIHTGSRFEEYSLLLEYGRRQLGSSKLAQLINLRPMIGNFLAGAEGITYLSSNFLRVLELYITHGANPNMKTFSYPNHPRGVLPLVILVEIALPNLYKRIDYFIDQGPHIRKFLRYFTKWIALFNLLVHTGKANAYFPYNAYDNAMTFLLENDFMGRVGKMPAVRLLMNSMMVAPKKPYLSEKTKQALVALGGNA